MPWLEVCIHVGLALGVLGSARGKPSVNSETRDLLLPGPETTVTDNSMYFVTLATRSAVTLATHWLSGS